MSVIVEIPIRSNGVIFYIKTFLFYNNMDKDPRCYLDDIPEDIKSLCACYDSTKAFTEALKVYVYNIEEHKRKEKSYNVAWEEYKVRKREWDGNKDAYLNSIKSETKETKNCVLWTDTQRETIGLRAQYCQNDYGDDWNIYRGGVGGGCILGQGKYQCGRSDNSINLLLNEWTNRNPEPTPPSGGTNGVVAPCSTCNPPERISIQCCSQLFSNISGDAVDVEAKQHCNQVLNEKEEEKPTETPVPIEIKTDYTIYIVVSIIAVLILVAIFVLKK